MRKILIVFVLLCLCDVVAAQREWEELFMGLATADEEEAELDGTAYETLCDLEVNPINVNRATREELEQIAFLDAGEIEEILEYVRRYGGMRTLGELAMIRGLGPGKVRLLRFFLYAEGEPPGERVSLAEMARKGRSEVLATGKVPFYRRRGDRDGYLGGPCRHSVRYGFRYGEDVRLGLVGAQDAGEPFFSGRNGLGYDFYSFFLMLRNKGRLKALVAGRYDLGFGMGLVVNNGFSAGKVSVLESLGRGSNSIRPHSSTLSGNYLQGAAATFAVADGLTASVFASHRRIDATLDAETGGIATIVSSGYHRTATEMGKKGNAAQTVAGGNVGWSGGGFRVGVTAAWVAFDKELRPDVSVLYRRHYARGKSFCNVGACYGYCGGGVTVSGEVATGDGGALATANSVSVKLPGDVRVMALQRFYGTRYHALLAKGFSEGGRVQNESGLYVGADWRLSRCVRVKGYTDYAYFAWPRYQVSQASRAWDNMLSAEYEDGGWMLGLRYRMKVRGKDLSGGRGMADRYEHRCRASVSLGSGRWTSRVQADMSWVRHGGGSFGWMVNGGVRYSHSERIEASGTVGFFNTKDYDSRVYSYERGMLYSMNYLAFYGKGVRLSLLAKAKVSDRLRVTAKVAATDYLDRDRIGSGFQLIDHSSMTDMEMQVCWKF